MDALNQKILFNLRSHGFNKMASYVEIEFNKGLTYSEVWSSLTLITELFKDTLWEEKYKNNS